MSKIKIVKKNDDMSSEYEVGDIFEIEGTWYGGVHISGKTGVPVSLDKDEYVELEEKPKNENVQDAAGQRSNQNAANDGQNLNLHIHQNVSGTAAYSQHNSTAGTDNNLDNFKSGKSRDIRVGDIVRHFKREWVDEKTSEYLYKIIAFAQHTENDEKLVVYQAMYAPFKVCARPYDMFMSEVDKEKYPNVTQKYRFEKLDM